MIDTLLIANRGEIACRIMRSARAMGIRTVAVHSHSDRDARHVREADMAINLGGSKPAESYLRSDLILAAAAASGAQAIHPGYGFLSENAAFARACEQQGLIFIGPTAAAIDAMGSKAAAKALMEAAGVPLVPGYHGAEQGLEQFVAAAKQMGYPVLLKAVSGGGGKGMKVVESEADLAVALLSAQREAQAAFGDNRMLVERYLERPRHIEIQVFADQSGHCIHLNERDCSIQRRHQKILEEAPAPGLDPQLRAAMGAAAVKAAQAIDYVGAGTVEFLLDSQGRFYFMEMNTRLQVEHPVTEAITGLDLVEWQLRIAQGQPLPLQQQQVPLNGHAIEVRLYAEDPDNDFLPASGTLALYREPAPREGWRLDSGVSQGDSVSPFYDPMLAKLIAWGDTREAARLNLLQMLEQTLVAGIQTNQAFLQRILALPAFAKGELDTGFIPRHQQQLFRSAPELDERFWHLAAQAWLAGQTRTTEDSPWTGLTPGWRAGLPGSCRLHLRCGDQQQPLAVQFDPSCRLDPAAERLSIELDGVRRQVPVTWHEQSMLLYWQQQWLRIEAVDPLKSHQGNADSGGLQAPMNGSIVSLQVQIGDQVEAGSVLLVLEAMKMEHSIRAPHAGTVTALFCREGELVAEGTLLVELEDNA